MSLLRERETDRQTETRMGSRGSSVNMLAMLRASVWEGGLFNDAANV
jgi:hypothetical protein